MQKERGVVSAALAVELGRARCSTAERIMETSFSTLHPSSPKAVTSRRANAVQRFQKSVQVLLKPPQAGIENTWQEVLEEHLSQPPREIALSLEENQVLKERIRELDEQLGTLRYKENETREVRREERRAAQEQRRQLQDHSDNLLKHAREREQEAMKKASGLQCEVKALRMQLELANEQLNAAEQRELDRMRMVTDLEEEMQALRAHYQNALQQAGASLAEAQRYAKKAEERWVQSDAMHGQASKQVQQSEDLEDQLRLAHLYAERMNKSWQAHVKKLEDQLREAGLDPSVHDPPPIRREAVEEVPRQEEAAAIKIQKHRRGQLGRREVASKREHHLARSATRAF